MQTGGNAANVGKRSKGTHLWQHHLVFNETCDIPSTLPRTFCIFSFVLDGQVDEFFKIFQFIFNTFCIFVFVFEIKMDPKIDAKSYPGDAWRHLGSLPEASRRPSTLVFNRNRPWMRELSDFENFPAPTARPLRILEYPKNSVKIVFLLKKSVPCVLFLLIFVHNDAFHAFCTIFCRFFTKNRRNDDEKNDVFFRIIACFFQHCNPHETMYFIIRKLLFRFLRFCIFPKKCPKTCYKIGTTFSPWKSPRNRAREPVLRPKMLLN